jgi:transcriptional regulator of acetoin/glycerol metabolism
LNICERIIALGGDSLKIDAASFDYTLALEVEGDDNRGTDLAAIYAAEQMEENERITEILKLCRHNKTQAAKMLGYARTTLWRKMKQYDIV